MRICSKLWCIALTLSPLSCQVIGAQQQNQIPIPSHQQRQAPIHSQRQRQTPISSRQQNQIPIPIPSRRQHQINDDDFALMDTPFREYVDYATWTQYLAEQLLKTGDVMRLTSVVNRLQVLGKSLTGADAMTVTRAVKRLSEELYELRIRSPTYQTGFDKEAEEIYDLLEHGHYFIAKEMLREKLHKKDYVSLNPSMKNVVILAGLIQYDGLNPKAILSLWSGMWNLSQDEKIAALIRAKQLCKSAREGKENLRKEKAFRNIARSSVIDARVLANLGLDVKGQFGETYIRDDPIEQNLLQMGMSYMNMDPCAAREHIRNALRVVTDQLRRRELTAIEGRLVELCGRKQLDSTYRTFCQVGHEAAYPIAEATSPDPVAPVISMYERMFWTRLTVGDCVGARSDLEAVRKIVPTKIIKTREYLISRMEFMEQRVAKCQPTPNLYSNQYGVKIIKLLQRRKYRAAYIVWKQFTKGSRTDPISQTWRTAILVSRYPKVIYAPCTGNSIITGIPNVDNQLFDRLELFFVGMTPTSCKTGTPAQQELCRLLWMRAAYATGRYDLARVYASRIKKNKKYCDEANKILACQFLCFAGRGYSEACQALDNYHALSPNAASAPHNAIGADLARRLCQSNKQMLLDPFYVRNGASPRPLTFIFRHYYRNFLYEGSQSLFPRRAENAAIQPTMKPVVGTVFPDPKRFGKYTTNYTPSLPQVGSTTLGGSGQTALKMTQTGRNLASTTGPTVISHIGSSRPAPFAAGFLGKRQSLIKGGWEHFIGAKRWKMGKFHNIKRKRLTPRQAKALIQAQNILCPCLAKQRWLMLKCPDGLAGTKCRDIKIRFAQNYQKKTMKKVCDKPKCRMVKCRKGDKKCKGQKKICDKPRCRLVPRKPQTTKKPLKSKKGSKKLQIKLKGNQRKGDLFGEGQLKGCHDGVRRAYRTFIKAYGNCGCELCDQKPEKVDIKFLVNSRALEVSAKMFASGQLQCPCLRKDLLRKHGISYDKLEKEANTGCCKCKCKCKQPRKDPLKEWRMRRKYERKSVVPKHAICKNCIASIQKNRAKLRTIYKQKLQRHRKCQAKYAQLVRRHLQKCQRRQRQKALIIQAQQQETLRCAKIHAQRAKMHLIMRKKALMKGYGEIRKIRRCPCRKRRRVCRRRKRCRCRKKHQLTKKRSKMHSKKQSKRQSHSKKR